MENQPHPTPPPQAVLGPLIHGYWISLSIHAAARLNIADLLVDGPKSSAEIARRTSANEDAVYRLLRALASIGIFTETDPGTFAQTPLSEALRPSVPGSMHGVAVMSGLLHFQAWPEIVHSVKTGETAASKVWGKEVLEHLKDDAEAAAAFDAAMAGYTSSVGKAVAAGYDFSRFNTVADIGGGSGALLSHILPSYPQTQGITFDLDHVTTRARAELSRAGLSGRCEAMSGDFFQSVPAADAYLMKMILHDWDDAKSIAILKNVRKAIRPNGRLLVVEAVIPPGNAPSPGKFLDVNMLVMTGGRERTEAEFRALYKAGGFELTKIVPVHPSASIVEGRAI
jgi:predicted O-methyltransferase YrrM